MSVISSRKIETPEETQLRFFGTLIDFTAALKTLMENPKLLTDLSDKIIAANKLTEDVVQARQKALNDIAAGTKVLDAVKAAEATLAAREKDVNATHASNLQAVEDYRGQIEDKLALRVKEISDLEDSAHAKHDDLSLRERKLQTNRETIEARASLLEKQNKDAIAAVAQKVKESEQALSAREDKLKQRAEMLDEKMKKIEDVKKALT